MASRGMLPPRQWVIGATYLASIGGLPHVYEGPSKLGLEQQGACTLGYNENAGARIHMRLRDDALRAMRPYRELVNTVSSSARANWS